MLGIHGAAADVDGRAVDLFDSKQIEREADANDVANGIDCADLMKVNFADCGPVDFRLRLANAGENPLRQVFLRRRQDRAGLDLLGNMVQMPVSVLRQLPQVF